MMVGDDDIKTVRMDSRNRFLRRNTVIDRDEKGVALANCKLHNTRLQTITVFVAIRDVISVFDAKRIERILHDCR